MLELQINSLFCKPVCKPDAARQLEIGGDGADRARWNLSCPPKLLSPRPPKTARDNARDTRRMAHNPEVAGFNPAPATKFAGQRPLPITEGASCLCRVHEIVHDASEEGRRAGWR